MVEGYVASQKKLKVGVSKGSGPKPGYKWRVTIVDFAFDEAMAFLNVAQYRHLAMQFKELACEDDPTRCPTVDVRSIENVYELRDKGGILGGLNVRVFFGVDRKERSVVVIGAIKKQNNGPTPLGDKVTMRRRWRSYLNGDYGEVQP